MNIYPQIKPIADIGLLIEFGQSIDISIHAQILAMDQAMQDASILGVIEMIPSYASLYVGYDPLTIIYEDLVLSLEVLISEIQKKQIKIQGEKNHWRIPVCYESKFSPDLEELADKLDLSTDAIVSSHSSAIYTVYMYGFAPGYAYLGGLPSKIQIPRKSIPIMGVKPKSVMVAGQQSLITTVTMPSGWWVIGKSGINPLNKGLEQPFMFGVGDTIKFEPVKECEFVRFVQG